MDSVFWIASCTKMIGGIACMQLVEQGKVLFSTFLDLRSSSFFWGVSRHEGLKILCELE